MKVNVGVQPLYIYSMGADLCYVCCDLLQRQPSRTNCSNLERRHAVFTLRMYAAVDAQQTMNAVAI